MWTYRISEGVLLGPETKNRQQAFADCYSGHGDGVNNPELTRVHDVGPIPPGDYTIGPFFHDAEKGPVVAHLTPIGPTDTFGRSGFMLHGDNAQMNHTASLGCIIAARIAREAVRDSGDRLLRVVP